MNAPPTPVRLVVVTIVVAATFSFGVWARLVGLERKIVWHDETATYLELAGHTQSDVRGLYDGRPLRVRDLRVFLDPAPETSAAAVVRALVAQEPHTPPAYALLARLGIVAFGHTGPRAISAIAGLAALAGIWLLARALFDVRAAWVATALVSVSPFHVRYAQEARPYALWTVAVLVASVVFLCAVRRGTWGAWMAYALAASAALYTHLLSLLVLLAHVVFVVLVVPAARAGPASRRAQPLVAFTAALLAFAPWALVLFAHGANSRSELAWTQTPMALGEFVRRWVGITTTVFLRSGADGGLLRGASEAWVIAGRLALSALVATLVGVSACILVRKTTTPTWLFVVLLGAVPALGLILTDVAVGGRRSMIPRYMVPYWIALELLVAGALTRPGRYRSGAIVVASALLLAGAASVWSAAPLSTWWDTNPPALMAIDEAARRIRATGALVVSDASPLSLLVLTRELPDGTPLRLGIPARLDDVITAPALVLYDPSPRLLEVARAARPTLQLCLDAADVRVWCDRP